MQPGAWRLPAEALECRVSDAICKTVTAPGYTAKLLCNSSADQIQVAEAKLSAIGALAKHRELLGLAEQIVVAPGELTVSLSSDAIAEALSVDALAARILKIKVPSQLRKRGVETKIILADTPVDPDEVLIRNVAKAHVWFDRIKAGETFATIAETEDASKRRIQKMIGLAFLAPDIVRDVMDGKQPLGLTSDWCLRHDIPSGWDKQRALIATL